jgi:uncharacterized membrane protein YbhN (UPF0104 family)
MKLTLAAAVIYFAGRQFFAHWSEISRYSWTINPYLLVLSVALHLLTFALFAQTWCILMTAFGHRISLRNSFKISYIANLGRYIPGKIWPIFGMIYLLKQINISKETAITSWIIGTFLGLPPALLAGAIAIAFYPQMLSGTLGGGSAVGPLVGLVVILGASLLSAFMPDKLMAMFNWGLRLIRRPPVHVKLDKSIVLKAYLGYFVSWVCYGAAFYTFANAVMARPDLPAVAGVGAFVAAYIIGYMAFFSPGGLGARELVLTSVLTPFLGSVAAGLAVTARVWNLVSEIIAAVTALLIKLEKPKE